MIDTNPDIIALKLYRSRHSADNFKFITLGTGNEEHNSLGYKIITSFITNLGIVRQLNSALRGEHFKVMTNLRKGEKSFLELPDHTLSAAWDIASEEADKVVEELQTLFKSECDVSSLSSLVDRIWRTYYLLEVLGRVKRQETLLVKVHRQLAKYASKCVSIKKHAQKIIEQFKLKGSWRSLWLCIVTYVESPRDIPYLPEKALFNAYNRGESLESLANRYRVSTYIIKSRLSWQGVAFVGIRGIRELPGLDLLYNKGIGVEEIATKFNVSKNLIKVRLEQDYGIKAYKSPKGASSEEIYNKWVEGFKPTEIAEMYSVALSTVYRRIREAKETIKITEEV